MGDFEHINKLVENLSDSGVLESRDREFTFKEDIALEKLSRNLLNHPQEWVLKAVQAGVAAGCSSIAFKFKRRCTEVQWSGLELRAALLREALAQSDRVGIPFIDELVIGLRGLLGVVRLEFSSDGSLSYDESRNPVYSDQVSSDAVILRVFHEGSPGRIWSAAEAGTVASQTQFLIQRCHFCPVPLCIDSRPVQSNRFHALSAWQESAHHLLSPTALVEVGLRKENNLWKIDGRPIVDSAFSLRNWNTIPVVSDTGHPSVGLYVLWISFQLLVEIKGPKENPRKVATVSPLREPNSVYQLRHGVICQTQKLLEEESFGAALAIDCSDSRTDLTGLAFGTMESKHDDQIELLSCLWKETKPVIKSALRRELPRYSLPKKYELKERLRFATLVAVGLFIFGFGSLVVFIGGKLNWGMAKLSIAFTAKWLLLPAILIAATGAFLRTPADPRTVQALEAMDTYL